MECKDSFYFKLIGKSFYFFLLLFTPFLTACADDDYFVENVIEENENRDSVFVDRELFKGKRISIIGNSRCTYKGFIPVSNRTFYPKGDVNDVSKTWWWIVLNSIGATLEINNSYSAGRVTNTHSTYPNYYDRIADLGNPDIIFFWGGVNDQNNGIPVGVVDFSLSDEDLDESQFAPAMIKLLRKAKELYKNSQIVIFIENDLSSVYANVLCEIAFHFDMKIINLNQLTPSKMDALHYDSAGMNQIASETIRQLFED